MQHTGFIWGIGIAVVLSFLARGFAQLPYIGMIGPMITAILLGIACRAFFGAAVAKGQAGISFTAQKLLRLGIILMGFRLNIGEIIAAGWHTLLLDILVITFALVVINRLGKKFGVAKDLATLVAVGTGICGAAAIGAVAPVIKAKEEDVTVAVTIIAVLGTVFALAYTALIPFLGLSPHGYGTFVGSTLHELAHVIAAAAPDGPDSSSVAILVKLGRVAFLVPVTLIIGYLHTRGQAALRLSSLPVPWFLFGFLGMAAVNTLDLLSADMVRLLVDASVFFLVMAMGAMGLNVRYADFLRTRSGPVLICLIGSLLLGVFGRGILWVFSIG
ncbi:MAG TPA: putative sulfate exporter family transporter [Selenomonadales bacterium]|nr:putative sulfate exporter family transporter [Selenomonadales bacterium]